MTTETTAVAKKEAPMSERFMLKVVNEFGSNVGEIYLSRSQKRLAQNYFIAIDAVLKLAEEKRLKKQNNRDPLPITWANVNMESLATSVVSASRIGWDPLEKNHVNLVPYKNNTTNKYDIGFLPGYRGIEIKAKKYGLDTPDNVIVEMVCKNDRFTVFKKDRANRVEGFEFEVTNPFDRGDIVGGFYYHEFVKTPEKNKLVVMSLKDILKRKPKYAGVEFWGGEKDIWEKGKKTGETEKVEGWFEKMVWKTVYRAAYSDITIDSEKIDEAYQSLVASEANMKNADIEEDYRANANQQIIDIVPEEVPQITENINVETGEITPETSGPSSADIDAQLAAEEGEEAPY